MAAVAGTEAAPVVASAAPPPRPASNIVSCLFVGVCVYVRVCFLDRCVQVGGGGGRGGGCGGAAA